MTPFLLVQIGAEGADTTVINVVVTTLVGAIGALFGALMWSMRGQISRLEKQVDQRDERDRTILAALERTVSSTYDALVQGNEATKEFRREIIDRLNRLDPPRGSRGG